MERDLKYRIIYKPESLSSNEDENTAVGDWQDVYGISRNNDVLGYWFKRRFTKTELREFITGLLEKVEPENMLEIVEACNALRQISERIRNDNWLVDVCYD